MPDNNTAEEHLNEDYLADNMDDITDEQHA
jgi:hypothetical protein